MTMSRSTWFKRRQDRIKDTRMDNRARSAMTRWKKQRGITCNVVDYDPKERAERAVDKPPGDLAHD